MTSHIPNVLEPRDGINYLNTESRDKLASGYEALAAWIRESPFPIPNTVLWTDAVKFQVASSWIPDEGFVKRIGSAAKLIGGKVEKGTYGYNEDFALTRSMGGGVKVLYTVTRTAVCEEKKEVKEVTKYVSSDPTLDAQLEEDIKRLQERRREIPTIERTVSEEVSVYECPPSLMVKEREAIEDEEVDLPDAAPEPPRPMPGEKPANVPF